MCKRASRIGISTCIRRYAKSGNIVLYSLRTLALALALALAITLAITLCSQSIRLAGIRSSTSTGRVRCVVD